MGIVVLVLFLGSAVVAVRRPPVAFGLIVSIYVIEQVIQYHHPYFRTHNTLMNFASFGILLGALTTKWMQRKLFPLTFGPLVVPIAVLVVFSFLTPLWALDKDVTMFHLKSAMPYLVAITFMAPLLINSIDDMRKAFAAIVYIGLPALMLLQFGAEWGPRSVILADGEFTSPLIIASLTGYVALTAVFLEVGEGRWWPLLRVVIAVECLVVAVQTGSRGQVFALGMAFGLTYLIRAKMRLPSLIVLGLALFVATQIAENIIDESVGGERWQAAEIQDDVLNRRLKHAGALLRTWADNPPHRIVLGLGNSAAWSRQTPGLVQYPHVVPLEVLAEEGIFGFVVYVVMLVGVWLVYLRIGGRSRKASRVDALRHVLLALIIFDFAVSLKQGTLLRFVNMLAFISLMGKLEWFTRQRGSSQPPA